MTLQRSRAPSLGGNESVCFVVLFLLGFTYRILARHYLCLSTSACTWTVVCTGGGGGGGGGIPAAPVCMLGTFMTTA